MVQIHSSVTLLTSRDLAWNGEVLKAGDTLSSRHVSSCDVNACS
jgi:hypothetical protein